MKAVTLFYDADFGVCTACVALLKRRMDSSGESLIAIPYQDEEQVKSYGMVDRRHGELGIQTLDADGRVRRDAEAVASCLRVLPSWRWLGNWMDWPLLRNIFQAGDRLVASNRTLRAGLAYKPARCPRERKRPPVSSSHQTVKSPARNPTS